MLLPVVFCVFQPSFGSHTLFEGTAEFSTCNALKQQMSDNLATYQESTDIEFPLDQLRHTRANAIVSTIIWPG